MMQIQTERSWFELWEKINVQVDSAGIYADLVSKYTETHRAYHTLSHIEQCLDELEQVYSISTDPNAIEMALWYHDAIYDIKSSSNEEASARFFQEMAQKVILPNAFIQKVICLILATKHTKVPTENDSQIMIDIDLSILGQAEEKFEEYEQQIRKEYEWVSDKIFFEKRSVILRSFLDRSSIYSTKFFRDKYETQARQNITRSLV